MGSGAVRDVDHIGITVSDMERAISFFRDVLGAQVTTPYAYDDPAIARAIGFERVRNVICQAQLNGKRFELLQYLTPEGRPAGASRPCDSGHMHLALEVEDIDAVAERMRSAGFEPAGPVQRGLGGAGLSAIYCYGFDGLVIELIDYHRDRPDA
jgi:catechol 2,3-dioxygenase-like lactoylglutathione lyase family enzyme